MVVMMSNLVKHVHKFWEFGAGHTVVAALCAHSVSISIGICQGYSAILIPQLSESSNFHLTPDQSSWLASLGAITNPIGSVLSGVLAEYCGRKISIQISSIPFVAGWLCIGLSDDINLLYAGRLITGIAAGMSTASYTYVGEISTPQHRGIFQALGPICASFGILFTYIAGYYLHWSTVSTISLLFALFSLISMHFLPESPAYLLRKNKTKESFQSLLWLRRNNNLAQEEVDKYMYTKTNQKDEGLKQIYLSPQTMKPFLILIVLFLLQELSGIYTILFYAVDFFEETDLDMDKYLSSIVVAAIRFIMSIACAFLLNKFGRKVLCMTSSLGMALTMLGMGIYFKYYELNLGEQKILTYFPLLCVLLNVFFSMLGMLPIPWILVGELFPLEVRPIMCGLIICIAQSFIFICVKVYYDLLHYLKFSGTLFLFFAASVLALVFCKFVVPETKNKSLNEIEEYFRKSKEVFDGGEIKGYDNKSFVLTADDLKAGTKRGSVLDVQINLS